jgi:ABC-type lipoprotein export system ATPase subunit
MGDQTVHALRGVSLDIEAEGDFVAIMGASGSGKSTLMNILGCLDLPTSGTYRWPARRCRAWAGPAGLDPQPAHRLCVPAVQPAAAHQCAGERGAADGLCRRQGGAAARTGAMARIAARGPGPSATSHTPAELSGGQQQRVAIARALVNQPQLILADEPTGALDSQTSEDIMRLLTELNRQGMTVVLVTHESDIAAWARRKLVFKDGLIVQDVEQRTRAEWKTPAAPGARRWRMNTLAAVAQRLRALAANTLRSILTMLGIIIGVAAVITMIAVGQGATDRVQEQMKGLGSNIMLVMPGGITQGGVRLGAQTGQA